MRPDNTFSDLVNLLQWHAAHQADRPIYTYLTDGESQEKTLTYGQLDVQARSIAAVLQDRQATGQTVMITHPPGLDFVAAFFGCLYARSIAVPTFPPRLRRKQPDTRFEAICKDSNASIILTKQSALPNKTTRTGPQWIATDVLSDDLAASWQTADIKGDQLAFLQYTSGSTATPKGVMVSHQNIWHNLGQIYDKFGHNCHSQGVIWLPPYHDMGLIGGILQPLYGDFPVTLMTPMDFIQKPLRWLQAISRYQATTSGGPNFAYDLCAREITPAECEGLDLSSWQVAFNGAEPIQAETLERFTAKFANVGFRREAFYPCYGLAEATLIVSGGTKADIPTQQHIQAEALQHNKAAVTTAPTTKTQSIVSCGITTTDQDIEIVEPETGQVCPPGHIGEIWLSGPSVAAGYWQRPEATVETFRAKLFHGHKNGSNAVNGSNGCNGNGTYHTSKPYLRTGDLGFMQDGELYITGRIKDILIVNGRNHYPQDIEATASASHEALQAGSCAVFTLEVDGETQLVIAQEVKRAARRHLDTETIFAAIHSAVVREHQLKVHTILLLKPSGVSKTHSGKIQRWQCQDQFVAKALPIIAQRDLTQPVTEAQTTPALTFSLLYFSSDEAEFATDKYRLLIEGAKFADQHGFEAVWIPERHFHAFGGLYPNPSTIAAALAMVTNNIRLRAGSVVMPLHDPVRVAEEWAVVDNLSGGRVDLSFARGWNPNDFIFAPEQFADNLEAMMTGLQTVQRLWQGQSITRKNGAGDSVDINIYPLPQQSVLSTWLTCTKSRVRFEEAGALGLNVLTALLFQTTDELAENIAAYRQARAAHGHDPATGQVTCMLHTFVGTDFDLVREQVRPPFIEYLKSSVNLWQHGAKPLDTLTASEQETLLNYAFERYFQSNALFGTPESCLPMVERLSEAGVDEIACLIDFGVDSETILANLSSLDALRTAAGATKPKERSQQSLPTMPLPKPLQEPTVTVPQAVTPSAPAVATVTKPRIAINGDGAALLATYLRTGVANVLQRQSDRISLDDPLIMMGFDSLMAARFIGRVKDDLNIDVSVEELFEGVTINQLVEILHEQVDLSAVPNIPSLEEATTVTAESLEAAAPFAETAYIDQFPEYRNLQQMLTKTPNNPYFRPHKGVANNETMIAGQRLINFSSYNYLGMAGDPIVVKATQAAIEEYGTSVSASRLISGEIPLHQDLERELAEFIGVEDSLVYIGGHTTNVTTIGHLLGPKDLILHDALVHNSVIQGIMMSGAANQTFPHNDWTALERLLREQRSQYRRVLIVIEGVYSMDGDIPNLPPLIELKQRYGALLMIDEAHSIGTIGQTGRGIGEYWHINPTQVDIWMGTLSKSFASCGGYIAGSQALIKYLKYTAPGFVYSVGISPPNTASALAALRLLKAEPERVTRLNSRARLFLELAKHKGLNTGPSHDSPVVPIIIGDSDLCMQLSHWLSEQGISVFPIIFPAVPEGAARLRFFLSAMHTVEQIHLTVDAIAQISSKMCMEERANL